MTISTMCGNFFRYLTQIFGKNLISFKGRLSRQDYAAYNLCYLFFLFCLICILAVLGLIFLFTFGAKPPQSAREALAGFGILAGITVFILSLFSIFFSLSLGTRRLHDMGLSGWHLLWSIVPFVSAFLSFTMILRRGTVGANAHGEDTLPAETDYSGPDGEFFYNGYATVEAAAQKYFPGFFLSTNGRLSCREFFFGSASLYLAPIILNLCLFKPAAVLGKLLDLPVLGQAANLLLGLLTLVIFVLSLSLLIRRNHDLGLAGVYLLLLFVPVLNLIYLFNLLVISGDYAANIYGAPRTVPTEDPELYLNDNY
ncbi:MAG: DUF805 domain-containing protein [Acidaminococcaceae bacterium]|jgi:uncharacterized membrane protein YhaH (DUF805 family)|nr:DUF805 domain-containing protein [Acidaminococcaceae bacterium]